MRLEFVTVSGPVVHLRPSLCSRSCAASMVRQHSSRAINGASWHHIVVTTFQDECGGKEWLGPAAGTVTSFIQDVRHCDLRPAPEDCLVWDRGGPSSMPQPLERLIAADNTTFIQRDGREWAPRFKRAYIRKDCLGRGSSSGREDRGSNQRAHGPVALRRPVVGAGLSGGRRVRRFRRSRWRSRP